MLSRYRSVATAAPNFALDLCAKAADEAESAALDLSALQWIFCGAEPVNAASIARFQERFARYGLRPDGIKPCYGLAEATLLVSGGVAPNAAAALSLCRDALARGTVLISEDGASNSQQVVCCGAPVANHQVVIVDPETLALIDEGGIGEVWFSGPSVAQGYWRNRSATDATFGAMTACGKGPFMRTGDLGFLKDGGLYITGRIKELIIIRGKNHYPHDIEATLIDSLSPFSGMRVAVFADESLICAGIVAYLEIPRSGQAHFGGNLTSIVSRLRQTVAQTHDLLLKDVYVLGHGTIPRTSSGKTQRLRCAQMYLRGEIDENSRTIFSTRRPAPSTSKTESVVA
jgi:acyl-CoA synthetase (AMP-forming)/AMP-acid ligase II